MARPDDKYIALWLEQVRRERKRIPSGGTQIDFDTWESMLVELQSRRSHDREIARLVRVVREQEVDIVRESGPVRELLDLIEREKP